jgi:tetratricopeptide (TPR) repeat protein
MPFHVFLSHSTADKPAVEELARRLAKKGIQAWLDKWHLIPGDPWQPGLEKALAESETCAVFVGPGGLGPWQNEEMRAAIDRRVRDSSKRFRVIPVLLPGAERAERSSLPTFLVAATWVEFRNSLEDPQAFHRLVCGIRGLAPGPGPSQALYEGHCPYRGLRCFGVEDAAFFFGREALIEWLLNALRPATSNKPVNRFLAIVGASGSGKSSLARAGLVSALNHDGILGSSRWPIVICRPGSDPLESLAVALSKAINIGQGASALADLIAEFQKNEKALHLTARQALPDDEPDRRLVVLVDQFEEVFTLCGEEELREALVRNLLHAAKVAQGQTLVILTMRADFYAKCAANAQLAAALSDHHVLVGPMSDDELRRAVERPTQLVGCELDAGLVDLLVQGVRQQPGALPLLQHALLELWEKREGRRLTVKAYQEIGKLEGALQRRADATLRAFSPEEQELCRRTFLRLTQPGEGTEDTKRRASMQELLSLSGTSLAEEAVIQKLANASLLTTEGDLTHHDVFVEVAHEALIRNWPQLRKWIDADRAGLRTRTRLTENAREWKNAGRDPAYLYQGARLAVAEEWAGSHPGELSVEEAEFLRDSREAQRQRQANELEMAQRLGQAEAERAEEAEKHARAELMAREKAELATHDAKQARDDAERLLNYLIFDLHDKLEPLGHRDILEDVQKRVDAYYEQIAGVAESDETLRQRAVAYGNQGNLFLNRGDLNAALSSHEKGLRIAERLTARDPANVEWQRDLAISYNRIGDVQQAQGAFNAALSSYEEGLQIVEKLTARDPANPQWQRDLAIGRNRIGDVRSFQGNLKAALSSYEEGLQTAEKLATRDPANPKWQRDLAFSHNRIGDIRRAQGDLNAALNSYQKYLKIAQRLAALDPANVEWQRELVVSHDNIGDVQQAQGDIMAALSSYEKAMQIAEKLAERDPANVEWQRDLAVSRNRIGDVQQAQGDLSAALNSYQKYLQIAQRLTARDPANPQWQRDLSISHGNIGEVQQARGDLKAALNSYQQYLQIAEKLAARDPTNTRWQRDLAVSRNRIGDVQQAQGDFKAALSSYEEGLQIAEKLAARDPANTQWQSDLAFSSNRIGDVQRAQGDLKAALNSYQKYLQIAQRLAAGDPTNVEWQRDLAISRNRIGDVQQAQGDFNAALSSYEEGLQIAEELAARDQANTQWQRDLAISRNRIGDVQQAQGDFNAALSSYEEGLQIVEKLAARDPANAQWQTDLVISLTKLADVFEEQVPAKRQQAIANFERVLKILYPLANADRLTEEQKSWIKWTEDRIALLSANQE